MAVREGKNKSQSDLRSEKKKIIIMSPLWFSAQEQSQVVHV